MLEKKLHEELQRFRSINKYMSKLIFEQEQPTDNELPPLPDEEGGTDQPAASGDLPPLPGDDQELGGDTTAGDDLGISAGGGGGGLPPATDTPADGSIPPTDGAELPDISDQQPVNDVEEIDITDLVNMTKNIKKDLDDRKGEQNDVVGKMDSVFSKLDDLEMKLSQMDQVLQKIDMLGNKIETMREKKPEEKLELRSLDSYPFNKKPNEFFDEKKIEMQASGKNEYILTKNDIQNYSDREIRQSFSPRIGNE